MSIADKYKGHTPEPWEQDSVYVEDEMDEINGAPDSRRWSLYLDGDNKGIFPALSEALEAAWPFIQDGRNVALVRRLHSTQPV